MSEEEVPAGPPAWPGGAAFERPMGRQRLDSGAAERVVAAAVYTYEPPPPPRRTSRLLMFGRCGGHLRLRGERRRDRGHRNPRPRGSGNMAGIQAAVVDIDTSLSDGAAAAGTGIVLTSAGVILTNYHVVDGQQPISVRLTSTGLTYPATEIGGDPIHDVAVLQTRGRERLRDGADRRFVEGARRRQRHRARQRRRKGGRAAVATGQVTALGQSITASDETGQQPRDLNGMIQTNAPIQPGDSGGPLVNSDGQVIGHGHRGERWPQRTAARSRSQFVRHSHRHGAQLRTSAPRASLGAADGCVPGVCPQDDTCRRRSRGRRAVGCATGW